MMRNDVHHVKFIFPPLRLYQIKEIFRQPDQIDTAEITASSRPFLIIGTGFPQIIKPCPDELPGNVFRGILCQKFRLRRSGTAARIQL